MSVRVSIGYALGENGRGVAYALPHGSNAHEAVRVPFGCRPIPALGERPAGYAALLAVAGEMHHRGVRRAIFEIDDPKLVREIVDRSSVPAVLTLPYVLLGCALNRFRDAIVTSATDTTCFDLEARARADVALHVAA